LGVSKAAKDTLGNKIGRNRVAGDCLELLQHLQSGAAADQRGDFQSAGQGLFDQMDPLNRATAVRRQFPLSQRGPQAFQQGVTRTGQLAPNGFLHPCCAGGHQSPA
jgi:hypothetical protein